MTTESTSSDHERYADWDGAYVVGALSHADRQEYERHLADCSACQAAVASLAPLPGLLGRLDPAEAAALLEEDPVATGPALPSDFEQRLLAAAGQTQVVSFWRRTSTRVGVGLAAAAAVAAAVVVPIELGSGGGNDRPVAVALEQKVATPLTANVAFTPTDWGTRVEMTCRYAPVPYSVSARAYSLYVIDKDGRTELISSWRAAPGDVVRTSGSTELALHQIRGVELRDAVTGRVLLSGQPT